MEEFWIEKSRTDEEKKKRFALSPKQIRVT